MIWDPSQFAYHMSLYVHSKHTCYRIMTLNRYMLWAELPPGKPGMPEEVWYRDYDLPYFTCLWNGKPLYQEGND